MNYWGGQRVCWPPLPNYWGGLAPPLPTPMLIIVVYFIENSRTEMARFAKNFLPIFFNLYTADPVKEKDPVKLAVFETVKCYFQIAEKPVSLDRNCTVFPQI